MNIEQKLNKVLGLEGAGQATKGAGQASTSPALGASTGSHPNKKNKRDKSNKRKISRPEA
jgi:hypothetical protein